MISIMIAVKDEEKYIERCLNSLIGQDFPNGEYEILIADGGSIDRTWEIVKRIAKDTEAPKITLLNNPGIIPPAGWNVCLENAKGEFILLFGGHAVAPKDFLKKNQETWDKYSKEIDKLAGVGGRYTAKEIEGFVPKLGYVLLNSLFSGSSSHKRLERPQTTSTIVFGMYKKGTIREVGGFDESLKTGGDLEMNMKLVKKGYKILTDPEIQFDYYPRTTFTKLLKQIWNYGVVKGRFLRRGYFIPKALIAPLFLLYVIGIILFSGYRIYLVPAAAYAILNIAFSLYNSIRHKEARFLITLPFMYSYVHLSSGLSIILGYLFGGRSYL